MSNPQARTREDVLASIAAAFEEAAPDGGGADFVRPLLPARAARRADVAQAPTSTAGAAAQPPRARPPPAAGRRERAGLQPQHRDRRLVQRAHRRPDRHRRHAVPRRLGHRRPRQRRHRHPPHRPPAARREPRRRRHAREVVPRDVTGKTVKAAVGELAESWMRCRSTARATRSAAPSSRRTVRHVLEDVREAVEDWPKMRSKCLVLAAELEGTPARGRRRRRGRRSRSGSCAGWPTTTSPSSATASTP